MVLKRLPALAFLLVFGFYGYFIQDIPLDMWAMEEFFTARTFPMLIAGAGVMLSLLLLVNPGTVTGQNLASLNWKPFTAVLMVLVTYGFVVETAGFLLSTAILMLATSVFLGSRNVFVTLLVSVGTAITFAFVMGMLDIQLPQGILSEWLGDRT